MDYHRFNQEYGGATGIKNGEIAVLKDDNFHYHVN